SSAHQPAPQQASRPVRAAGAKPVQASPNGNGNAGRPAAASAYATAPGTNGGSAQAPGAPSGTQPSGTQEQAGHAGARRPGQKLSRYQQLLNEAAQRGGVAPAASARGNVDLAYVEDVPSADDVTLEDSGLVGRKAIERILGGRLIEERSLDGHGVHR
ncbi:hypothetical protein TVC13_16440, partial [Arthrobacter sp. 3Tela_A]